MCHWWNLVDELDLQVGFLDALYVVHVSGILWIRLIWINWW